MLRLQKLKTLLYPTVTALTIAVALTACNKQPTENEKGNAAGGAPQAIPVNFVAVQPQSLPQTFEAVGQAEGAREIEVRARVGGILEKRLFQEGSFVKAGQVLYKIDPVPYEIALSQAKAQMAQQKALFEQATRESTRLKGLLDQQAISRKEYEDSTSQVASTKANLQAAEAAVKTAELNLSYTKVTAPESGITGRSLRSEGSLISTADPSALTTITQHSPIWVRFSLSESDLAKLPGKSVSPQTVSAVQITLPDGTVISNGKLNFSGSRINNSLGTLELRAEFNNADHRILPGQFVSVGLSANMRENIYLVPQNAIMQTGQAKVVMLMNAENKVEPRPIQVAEWHGKDWVVTGGLQPGDKIIVDNLLKLRPGVPVVQAPPPANAGAPGEKPEAKNAPAKQ